jgi:hypothetical protein
VGLVTGVAVRAGSIIEFEFFAIEEFTHCVKFFVARINPETLFPNPLAVLANNNDFHLLVLSIKLR